MGQGSQGGLLRWGPVIQDWRWGAREVRTAGTRGRRALRRGNGRCRGPPVGVPSWGWDREAVGSRRGRGQRGDRHAGWLKWAAVGF